MKKVEEKKMLRGVTFMVDGKMCVSVSRDNMMCRIDLALQESVLDRRGCLPVKMAGRENKGFVYVSEEGIRSKKDFDYWISLSLDFNKRAKASPKRKKVSKG